MSRRPWVAAALTLDCLGSSRSLLAATVLPLVARALTITTPSQWLANTTVTVDWISITTDAEYFSIFVSRGLWLGLCSR